MKAFLVGGLLLCALVALPATASAHTIVCGFGDAPCLVGCLAHALLDDHPCGMEVPPRCPSGTVGFPPACVPV